MHEKIIIENKTKLPMYIITRYVTKVISMGKISGEGKKRQYCYHTAYGTLNISAFKNEKSDRFVVWEIDEETK